MMHIYVNPRVPHLITRVRLLSAGDARLTSYQRLFPSSRTQTTPMRIYYLYQHTMYNPWLLYFSGALKLHIIDNSVYTRPDVLRKACTPPPSSKSQLQPRAKSTQQLPGKQISVPTDGKRIEKSLPPSSPFLSLSLACTCIHIHTGSRKWLFSVSPPPPSSSSSSRVRNIPGI